MTIRFVNVSRSYRNPTGKKKILSEINLSLKPGDEILLSGASGAGKTTLLNIIGLLDFQFSGAYELDGTPVKKMREKELASFRNERFGYIFQEYRLIEEETVADNLSIPLLYRGGSQAGHKQSINRALEQIQMEGFAQQCVRNISGGQRQRVSIARALVNSPGILLADEPFSAMDEENRRWLRNFLFEYKDADPSRIFVIVTHRPEEFQREGQRRYELRDGKLLPRS